MYSARSSSAVWRGVAERSEQLVVYGGLESPGIVSGKCWLLSFLSSVNVVDRELMMAKFRSEGLGEYGDLALRMLLFLVSSVFGKWSCSAASSRPGTYLASSGRRVRRLCFSFLYAAPVVDRELMFAKLFVERDVRLGSGGGFELPRKVCGKLGQGVSVVDFERMLMKEQR